MPKAWRTQQTQDRFFRQAKQDGYRARSAYKLLEINERFRLIRLGITVLDLGAAPGSWSQVVVQHAPKCKVVAVDLLAMDPMPGVEIIRGDMTKPECIAQIQAALSGGAHLVLCDAAPNTSGIALVDHAGSIRLGVAALRIAQQFLKEGGAFVVKIFQGEDLNKFVKLTKQYFQTVQIFRPQASRQESTEHYVVCLRLRDRQSIAAIPREIE
ncbi:MAG: RlmE family RNA methyltransferase [Anaerolineales bacterium]|nr:RlmE family RNA methyltransferase [Anaerolineales bacterium]